MILKMVINNDDVLVVDCWWTMVRRTTPHTLQEMLKCFPINHIIIIGIIKIHTLLIVSLPLLLLIISSMSSDRRCYGNFSRLRFFIKKISLIFFHFLSSADLNLISCLFFSGYLRFHCSHSEQDFSVLRLVCSLSNEMIFWIIFDCEKQNKNNQSLKFFFRYSIEN